MIPIRVLLAEDHTMVRKGLRSLLEQKAGIEVVGEAADGREAVARTRALQPDVVVMDISMPGLNGLEATRQIVHEFPPIKVLMLTMHTDEEYILQAMQVGGSGFVVKQAAPEELVEAVHAAARGEFFVSPAISRTVVKEYRRRAQAAAGADTYERLTPREREVLQLIAEGHPSREIAALLHISVKTVESHRRNVMIKLGLGSTAELTQYAIRKGIIAV